MTPVRFVARDIVLSWRSKLAHPVQVTEDRGDHIDMTPEEEEEYRGLLRDLEPSSKEKD